MIAGKGYLLIDGSNIGHIANNMTKLKIGELETQAIFGFCRMLRAVISAHPNLEPIVLWDGISWRKDVYPDYKAQRDKEPETKSEIAFAEGRKSFNKQKPLINKATELLGVTQIIAMNLEADDLASMMVLKAKKEDKRCLMISGDKDWIQLVDDKISWFDPVNNVLVTKGNLESVLGVKTPRAWLECKAVMGDQADNMPGVGGIGEKGAKELINEYGSVDRFLNGTIDGTVDAEKISKKFKAFLEEEEKKCKFHLNMKIMDLKSSEIPKPINLKITKGDVNEAGFKLLCEKLLFKSILTDLSGWIEPFNRRKDG